MRNGQCTVSPLNSSRDAVAMCRYYAEVPQEGAKKHAKPSFINMATVGSMVLARKESSVRTPV